MKKDLFINGTPIITSLTELDLKSRDWLKFITTVNWMSTAHYKVSKNVIKFDTEYGASLLNEALLKGESGYLREATKCECTFELTRNSCIELSLFSYYIKVL